MTEATPLLGDRRKTTKPLDDEPEGSALSLTGSSKINWDEFYAKWASGETTPGSSGSVTLRIGKGDGTDAVKGDGIRRIEDMPDSAIGDDDPWDIRSRRRNTVTRRLRLWVRWASLVSFLDCVVSPEEARKVQAPNLFSTSQARLEDTRKITDEIEASLGTTGIGKNGTPSTTTTCVNSLPPVQSITTKPTLTCRVTWCGKLVASFELCHRTGLLLTPGECLLALPQGMCWSSCNLLLELVATEYIVNLKHLLKRSNSAGSGSGSSGNNSNNSSNNSNSSGRSGNNADDRSSDDGNSTEGDSSGHSNDDTSVSDIDDPAIASDDDDQQQGSSRVLGVVMVDWKVRRETDVVPFRCSERRRGVNVVWRIHSPARKFVLLFLCSLSGVDRRRNPRAVEEVETEQVCFSSLLR